MEKPCTKTEILKTALDLMWARSYGAVSVDDICRQAKSKKGSFYHFFPSKADLAAAALDMLWEQSRAELDKIFSPQTPPLDRLRAYADATVHHQELLRDRLGYVIGCPYTSIGSEQCSCDDGLTKKANEVFGKILVYLQSALKDAVEQGVIQSIDPKVGALRLLTYELGALALARVSNSLAPLEGFYDAWLSVLQARAS